MCYFRALLKKEEISLRMYDLSGIVITLLCSNYTA